METLTGLMIALALYASDSVPNSSQHFQHTLETTAPAAEVWRVWTDVEQWPTWDVGLRQARIDGSFAEGTRGKIVSDQGQKTKFKITAVDEGRAYTFETKLPLGRMEITRSLVAQDDTVRFTHTVRFRGITGKLFARRLGTGFQKMLPVAMQKIKQQAER